jgi:RimJ/RimL family protein N-acetyltransferase
VTGTVELVRLGPEHMEALRPLLADPEVTRFTRLPSPMPDGFPEQWVALYDAGREEGTRELFAVLLDGTFAGVALAAGIKRTAQEAELGYMVAPALARRGIATEALRLLTDWAFGTGLVRLTLQTDAGNVASQRVAEKNGYHREGVQRSLYVRPGARADTVLWSRLISDGG